jgi:hypothetical protein
MLFSRPSFSRLNIVVVCLLTVAACSSRYSGDPRGRVIAKQDYKILAACFFANSKDQPFLKFVNLEGINEIRIINEISDSGFKFSPYELTFKPLNLSKASEILIRSTPTIGSENLHVLEIRAVLNSCAENEYFP